MSELEEETRFLVKAVLGKNLVSLDPDEIVEVLEEEEVLITFESHQWTLQKLQDERAYFFDPAGHDVDPGTEIGETERLPAHRIEASGGSVEIERLLDWVEEGKARASRFH